MVGLIIGGIIYIAICEGICGAMELKEFNQKAWVYAIVSVVGGFLLKVAMS